MYNLILQIRKAALLGAVVWAFGLSAEAQTVYVPFYNTNTSTVSLTIQTNQLISIVGGNTPLTGHGPQFSLTLAAGNIYTGLTNISLVSVSGTVCDTLAITTPQTSTVVSNYVPADCLVIPSSSSGNVQVILETSPDLINWTAAEPGTYSAANGTNRFFRVRAVAQ